MRYFVKIESIYGAQNVFNFKYYGHLRDFIYCHVTVFGCEICKIYDAVDEVYISEESVYMDYVEDHPL